MIQVTVLGVTSRYSLHIPGDEAPRAGRQLGGQLALTDKAEIAFWLIAIYVLQDSRIQPSFRSIVVSLASGQAIKIFAFKLVGPRSESTYCRSSTSFGSHDLLPGNDVH